MVADPCRRGGSCGVTEGEYDDFFRDVYPKLVGLGLAMSTPRQVAQDLAQETLIRAYAHRDRLAGLDSPYGWCRRVMSNLLIDQHRRGTAERRAVGRLARERVVASDLDTASAGADFDGAWAQLMEPLSKRQRCVATLYYAEDRSVAEIADDLGWSVGSVKATLARVRRKVSRRLHDYDEHEEMRS
jgi:RNA polymerase sigma-70 factor (ECF subfamily)